MLPDHVRDLDGKLQDMILMRCDLSMLCDGMDLAVNKES